MKVAINGFGRIGKQFFLACMEQKVNWDFVINEPGTLDAVVYSLKYDSVHPVPNVKITHDGKNLIFDGKKIKIFHEMDPLSLPWEEEKIDLVVECTGFFTEKEGAMKHIAAGAKKVLISAPSKDLGCTIVHGVNTKNLTKDKILVSAGSCTTNDVSPMLKVLHDAFTVKSAQFVTTHAYTATQKLIDGHDKKDFRRGRSAALNISPSTSGASTSVVESIPELKGKLAGFALRVPVEDGSITNVVAKVGKKTTKEEINKLFKSKAQKEFKGIIEYNEDEIVSRDIIHNPHSCIFDSTLTLVVDDLVSISGWYDNEWGYSNRLVDLAKIMLKR